LTDVIYVTSGQLTVCNVYSQMFLSPTKLLSKLDLAVVRCATKWPSYKPQSRQSSDNSKEPYETKLYRHYILRHRIISIISGSDFRQRNGSQNASLYFNRLYVSHFTSDNLR